MFNLSLAAVAPTWLKARWPVMSSPKEAAPVAWMNLRRELKPVFIKQLFFCGGQLPDIDILEPKFAAMILQLDLARRKNGLRIVPIIFEGRRIYHLFAVQEY